MSVLIQQLLKLDLSPLVPKRYRAKAKAYGAAIIALAAVAVQLAVIDADTEVVVTTLVLGVLTAIGVHQTTNRKR